MAHTLVEYAKGYGSDKGRAIIELFPESSDFLEMLPFKPAPGGAYTYQQEAALPSNMAFRGINGTVTDGYGLINDRTEVCYPIQGQIKVDRVLIDRHGPDRRAMEERMSVKKKAITITSTFITGDNSTAPTEPTGLKQRLRAVGSGASSVDGSNYESRQVANNVASGGGPLSLKMLDLAISLVPDANAILLPYALKHKFGAAVRNAGVGGLYTNDKEDAGHRVERYMGIRLLTGYGISKQGPLLQFNEVGYGGGSAVTASAYILRFGEDGVCGLETKPMEVTDFGLDNGGIYYITDILHDIGMCVEDPYAALRMTSITNADIVA